MAIFLTGVTGYLGSYLAASLLDEHRERLALLVRARSTEEAEQRLWRSLQLHLPFDRFLDHLRQRVDLYLGDLTLPDLGLALPERARLVHSFDSVIHCAATLNRKSNKACFNVNLRGTLAVIKLARAAQDHHGLRRFSEISTVGVAGERRDEMVHEDQMVDWQRSDYDPYGRTKKFCEHMVRELLWDVPFTIFRPSTVLGDSRFPETTQFDMVRAFAWLAQLPLLPFRPEWRMDIVPADYVARAIVTIHQRERPQYDAYNVSAGSGSQSYEEVVRAMGRRGHRVPRFAPSLQQPFGATVRALAATPRRLGIAPGASLMMVFLPYLTYNTVFDNARVREELGGVAPVPFSEYAEALLRFAKENGFRYPYRPWPAATSTELSNSLGPAESRASSPRS